MKMTLRWYGEKDSIKIDYIRQIPNVEGVVSAIYDVAVGEVWSEESISALTKKIQEAGLKFEVVESVPVHEDIKLGKPTRDLYIKNYCENIRRLAKHGVKCICYNFMPIFDWTRTQLFKEGADKSTSLVYYQNELDGINPYSDDISLPGWDSSYTKADLKKLFDDYSKITKEDLWQNLGYFLQRVIPVAIECDVKMAIHPDDPPWDIFGLPRIITCEENVDRFLKLYDSVYNGITFCTGSYGCSKDNDVIKMINKYAAIDRIHFFHARNVKILPNNSFEETAHFSSYGSLDFVEIIKALHKHKYNGYIRPDHGRGIWGEDKDKNYRPGYGLYDRALGAMYLIGIWETLEKVKSVEEKKELKVNK